MQLSKLAIPKPDLAQFAAARNFSQRLTTNYLVHSVLAEAFSECPTPFDAQDKGRLLRVLFYSDSAAEELHSHAKLASSPEACETIRWRESACNPLLEAFLDGMMSRFGLRSLPSCLGVRNALAMPVSLQPSHRLRLTGTLRVRPAA